MVASDRAAAHPQATLPARVRAVTLSSSLSALVGPEAMAATEVVAATAVEQYGVGAASLSRLGGLDTINYRVDAGGGRRFLLRLHDPARHAPALVASELQWLAHLTADTELILPRPVRNRRGQTVTVVEAPPGHETVCTLLRWVEGEPLGGAFTDEHARQAGEVMARLHASAFRPPPGFAREVCDAAYFARCLELLLAACGEELAPDDVRAMQHGTRALTALVRRLPRTPATFGLIHADFHPGNYVMHGDELRVIDFGRCAFGYHAFDIATALELDEARRNAFLAGYASIRPWPPGLERHHDAFVCLTYLDNLGFLATIGRERAYVLETVPAVADALGRYAERASRHDTPA